MEWMKSIKSIGVKVLNDEFISSGEFVMGVLTSSFCHKCEKYDPNIPMALYPKVEWLEVFETREGFKILFDHHPENYEPYTKSRNINLILSGHAQGGQIRLFGKGIYGRSQGFFTKYDGGLFDKKLVVSRGGIEHFTNPKIMESNRISTCGIKMELKGRRY